MKRISVGFARNKKTGQRYEVIKHVHQVKFRGLSSGTVQRDSHWEYKTSAGDDLNDIGNNQFEFVISEEIIELE